MHVRILFVSLVVLLAFTMACGPLSLLTQSQPTATPVPAATPTIAAAAPTATTAVAPAATAVPTKAAAPAATPAGAAQPTAASGGDFGSIWSSVEGRTATATKYRMSMSMIIGATSSGVYTETPFLVSEGWVVLTDTYQVFTGGFLNELLGGTKIEMIQAGGKSYMKGGAMFGLMDATKWYAMSDSTSSSPPIEPSDMLSMAGGDAATIGKTAKKLSTETLDGQSCDVWAWPITDTVGLLGLTGMMGNPDSAADLAVTDKSEVRSWICRDNYVHKVTMEIAGHSKDNVNEKGSLKFDIHIWDFDNATLSVKAPEGALPFGN